MARKGIQNYVNTVIFCVVLKIISIIILGAILLGYVNEKIMYFLITVEIGIVVIVIAALLSIAAYERKIADETDNLLKAKMTIVSCPDYHTQSANNVCLSNYTTPDGRFTYVFGGGSNVLLGNYINKPMVDACSSYTNDITSIDKKNNILYKYPWTDLQSKCDVL